MVRFISCHLKIFVPWESEQRLSKVPKFFIWHYNVAELPVTVIIDSNLGSLLICSGKGES